MKKTTQELPANGTRERLFRRRAQRMTALSAFATLLLVSVLSFASVYGLASQSSNETSEARVGQGQLIMILHVPSIQKELALTDEQLTRIAGIKVDRALLSFSEAIAPLRPILTDEQLWQFKRIAFQGLMVRAFSIPEVREALELTPEQVASIAAIQEQLKNRLQPFQDKLMRQESVDPLKTDRDTAAFHREAYLEAVELLTVPQRKIWEEIAKPVP